MKITLNDTEIFASTGGREFDPSGKTLMFIHGSGQSHLGFMLQHRFFANRGWQCVTPDMPGHGLSSGKAFKTVEEMADWYASFIQAVGIKKSSIIGHSMGGLIALELASRYSDLVSKAVFISTALAISVNDTLIDMAANDESEAIAAMMD